jgi:hypothetical protein
MTMRHLFLSLPTMNDNNGSEATCLPVRGPRPNASHAVGLTAIHSSPSGGEPLRLPLTYRNLIEMALQ